MMARGADERSNPNRKVSRFDVWSSGNSEMPQGNISANLADLIKQAAYDAEFAKIIGNPDEIGR